MGNYQHKPETGSLFKNDRKTSDSHPNAKGEALIDGAAYWIDAWTNDKNGTKYQSLKFKRKDVQPATAPRPVGSASGRMNSSRPREDDNGDSDPPF